MSTQPGRKLCTREVIYSQHQWVRGQGLCLHGEGSGQMWSLAKKLGLPGTQGESKAVSCCRSWRICQKYGGSDEAKGRWAESGLYPSPMPRDVCSHQGTGGPECYLVLREQMGLGPHSCKLPTEKHQGWLHIWFKARPSPLQKAGWPVQPASAAVQGCVQSQKHMAPSGGLP